MAQQSVTLNPGESKVVGFEVTPTVAKSYLVSVDGLSGSFGAIAPPIVTDKIGILLKNPPAGAIYWRYGACHTIYECYSSPDIRIGDIGYLSLSFPSGWMSYAIAWHMSGDKGIVDGDWSAPDKRAQLYFNTYGLYEYDWQAHTLVRIS